MVDTHTHSEEGHVPKPAFVEEYRKALRERLSAHFSADEKTRQAGQVYIGREFLHACERGNPETIKIFLDCGIDVNYQNPQTGQTALHASSAARARQAIRVLLASNQCDFLIRDNKGRLPSELAYLYGRDPALARLLGNLERKQAEGNDIKLTRRPLPNN